MNRLGELSFRGTMPHSKEATDFRAKLIESGWFDAVVLEEQTPVKDQQKVTVKISSRWRRSPAMPPQIPAESPTNATPLNAAGMTPIPTSIPGPAPGDATHQE
jgi:hypothetical protein